MKNELDSKGSSLTRPEIESIVQEQLGKLTQTTASLIEQKVKEILQKESKIKEEEQQKRGKPLSGFLEFTSYFSNQASSVNRSLALAGIGIIWIFKKPINDQPPVKGLLNLPLMFLAISLSLDLLQYFFGALGWNTFYEVKYKNWKKRNFEPSYAKDIIAPNYISIPISSLFVLKVVAMAIAYFYIIRFLTKLL